MKKSLIFRYIVFAGFIGMFVLSLSLFIPTMNSIIYPRSFIVSKGESIRSVATRLKEEKVINSISLFIISSYLLESKVLSGSYHFNQSKGVFLLTRDFASGNKNLKLTSVVIKEGSNMFEIAKAFKKKFPNFKEEEFLALAEESHGYLYPDTYFFAPDEEVEPERLISLMKETFGLRVNDLFVGYDGKYSMDEIITLASIVELEASKREDREKIASVLYNRLDADIPLQVDVSFLFINGKSTFQLSREDLKIDDPSNTYRYAGIPPIPIANPSRDSIEATLFPAETDYFYFLADKNRTTYFSKTFQEHLLKKTQFLTYE